MELENQLPQDLEQLIISAPKELSLVSKGKYSFLVKTALADLIPELALRKQLSEIRLAKKLDAIDTLSLQVLLGYYDEQLNDYIDGMLEISISTNSLFLNQERCRMLILQNQVRPQMIPRIISTMRFLKLNDIKQEFGEILLQSQPIIRLGLQNLIRQLISE